MKIPKCYVLSQRRTDKWGRTRRVYFRRDGPHYYRRVSRLTEATHFRDRDRAEEVLSIYSDFDAWAPTHVPLALMPDSLADEIRGGLKTHASGV